MNLEYDIDELNNFLVNGRISSDEKLVNQFRELRVQWKKFFDSDVGKRLLQLIDPMIDMLVKEITQPFNYWFKKMTKEERDIYVNQLIGQLYVWKQIKNLPFWLDKQLEILEKGREVLNDKKGLEVIDKYK